jgi:2-dehydro-3-deoxyphosphogalactonate aldolase
MSESTPFPKLNHGLVAILRGLRPEEAVDIASAVFEAGIEAIEVPLNSPNPFTSIERIVAALPSAALLGAGTVLTADQVDRLAGAGGRLLVSPNIDAGVMHRAAHHGLVTMPGVFTPSEAFQALGLGASALKFFPASTLGPKGIAAIMAVLPGDAVVGAVGGVSDKDFADYAKIGVRTFGLGSSLFAPGMSVAAVRERAVAAVGAWRAAFGQSANG